MSLLSSLFPRRSAGAAPALDGALRAREAAAPLDDGALKALARRVTALPEVVGVTAVVATRVLGLQMFDTQLAAALALGQGHIVEMQTGEGKTLAAAPAIAWFAKGGEGVHVLTANDYLAARDAAWMGGIYEWFGLSVGTVGQRSTSDDRRRAYRADITYTTANEVGFDYLRDGLAMSLDEQVHRRPFAAAVIDEADSVLIDEARLPLVIAGGTTDDPDLADLADRAVRELLSGHHYELDGDGRHVLLTPAGVRAVEHALGCDNLFADEALATHTAVQDALHAHALLLRDVDYVVADGAVLPVDVFKGRLVPDRRWPAGLQTAIEHKEGVRPRAQGRVLGSITVEHLAAMYGRLCGMTGTAATQADEFRRVYGLGVTALPTHKPIARVDHPDREFARRVDKEIAVRDEIRRLHETGRPVLVGTASVDESDRLSRALGSLPHHVLNARHEAAEAAIVSRAGERGAITISTNMAGRGVDIRLGEGVAELGGLHVIGTNRHESRRIDHHLRGRAGRQGDPGSSEFFISKEDPLIARLVADDPEMSADQYQRVVEGQHLDTRLFLRKYESVIEAQRTAWADRRQTMLETAMPPDARRRRLEVIDDLWADYLAAIAHLRSGTAWISMGYQDPFQHYLGQVHAMYGELERAFTDELARADADSPRPPAMQRGATWTYLTTDEPFGRMTERFMRRLLRRRRA
jgi:preprotein translocase subunit SecA